MTQTILVIYHYMMTMQIVHLTLEPQGYRVIDAQGGQDVIDIAITQAPDLILLEHPAPGSEWDGFEICFALRANPQTQSIPIIMCIPRTTFFGDAAPDCPDAYLTKPWAPNDIVDLVKEILARSTSAAQPE